MQLRLGWFPGSFFVSFSPFTLPFLLPSLELLFLSELFHTGLDPLLQFHNPQEEEEEVEVEEEEVVVVVEEVEEEEETRDEGTYFMHKQHPRPIQNGNGQKQKI